MYTKNFTFNTGRGYSPEGQRIHAQFVIDETVSNPETEMHSGVINFYDETRGIWGSYSHVAFNSDSRLDLQHALMVAYDNASPDHLRGNITFDEARALMGVPQ